ncbi:MarR family winged helix-turn-helix transcriptional regulator [Kosmotoga pacifica]|uniref:MarR family transcriptional regulator n=1 Tax=Kosmotoga pacifica TaxID=1330330 RepID=A0A0G2Z7X1_9BACT|nr:MarR family transcriptional regulator [Kosmotoga pacifica]AKI97700.1 MarR family transcriptional regulator [Kosmotoga pacifica]
MSKKGQGGLATEIEKTLRAIYIRIKREGRKVLKDFPITPAQFDVLQTLYFSGEKRMSDISKILGITKSTTTGLVHRLIEGGFIERRRSKEDRRSYIIDISGEGIKLIEKVIKRRVSYLNEILTKLENHKPEELLMILDELLDAMKKRG